MACSSGSASIQSRVVFFLFFSIELLQDPVQLNVHRHQLTNDSLQVVLNGEKIRRRPPQPHEPLSCPSAPSRARWPLGPAQSRIVMTILQSLPPRKPKAVPGLLWTLPC